MRRPGHVETVEDALACVAALSQRELDLGRDFCFLFTELSNSTSNHTYQQIGYEGVGTLNRYLARTEHDVWANDDPGQ